MRGRLVAFASGHHRGTFVVLVLLALAVRLGTVAATPGYVPIHDDADYDRHACWIVNHGFPALQGTSLGGHTTTRSRAKRP